VHERLRFPPNDLPVEAVAFEVATSEIDGVGVDVTERRVEPGGGRPDPRTPEAAVASR
jgi:hypothetical protein